MDRLYLKTAFSIFLSRLGKRTPLEVCHQITMRCNLRCKYCIFPYTRVRELNTQQIKQAMKEFADAGTIAWSFTGGEPLLREDIGELINFANDQGIRTTVVTNGILFKKRMNELKNVGKIFFSLDGPKEIHEKMRGKGTYDKVIEAIKLAKKANFNVYINTVIQKDHIKNNLFGMKHIFALVKKFDLGITLFPVSKRGENLEYYEEIEEELSPEEYFEKIQEQFISPDEYLLVLRLIREFYKKGYRIDDFSNGMCNEIIKMCKNEKSELRCHAGISFCSLLPDGKISSCLIKKNESLCGLKNGFMNAFYSLPSYRNCSCFSCFTRRNLFYSLDLDTLKNTFLRVANLR